VLPNRLNMNDIFHNIRQITANINNYTYEEINQILSKLIPHVPIIIYQSDKIPRSDKGLYRDPSIIYRARPNKPLDKDSTMEMPWTRISEISLVPEKEKEKIVFGRANKEKQSRFYASNDYQVACYEVIWHKFPLKINEKDQKLTVGKWKIIKPLNLAYIPYSINYLSKILNYGIKIQKDIYKIIEDEKEQINNLLQIQKSDINRDKSIIEYFSNEFAKLEINCKNDYFLSNFYCDQVFEKCPNENGILDIDGIIFPSVSFSYEYYNIVLHPRSMLKIKFIEAMYIWVTYDNDIKKMQFTPLEQNVNADESGQINWNLFKQKK
jgi:hypothetical protein